MSDLANWQNIEQAIQQQIVAASGLPGGRVIWEGQNRDRPGTTPNTRDLIELRWGDIPASSATPEKQITDTVAPLAGEEITIKSIDHDQVPLIVKYLTGKNTGTVSARAKLSAIKNYLNRDATVEALNSSEIALIDFGPVQAIPALLETEYESCAVVVIRLGVVQGADEKTTYIETAEWAATLT